MKKNRESCEICGKQEVFAIIEIEGAKLRVCRPCAYGKKILYYLDENEGEEVGRMKIRQKPIETEEIVDGYGKIIKQAREKLGLPIQVLAEKIKEGRSYMEKIERGEIKPTIATAKKLEKELGISLIEKTVDVAPSSTSKRQNAEQTLGDLLGEGEE